MSLSGYPGGSKTRVTRAGAAVRGGTETPEDLEVINVWRAAHKPVLNTFQSILRNRTKSTDVVVAQRHKRKRTIFGKLRRYPKMDLARMDDVAGCRLIFPNIEKMYEFRRTLHKARFKHVRKNDDDKYDYVKFPKDTGYRGIHDVYEYNVSSATGAASRGLLLELQYRTRVQHAWATTVEVIGHVTASQPKFSEGDNRYELAMLYASEILARSHEQCTSALADMSDDRLLENFYQIDNELGLLNLLRRLNAVDCHITAKLRNVILILETEARVVKSFSNATAALKVLFEMERENPVKDIVLVMGNTGEDVREAFRNYFSDAREFISLIDAGCKALAGKRVVNVATRSR